MSNVRAQANAIINTCKAVMAGKSKDASTSWGVDKNTYEIATAIIAAAKSEVPDDKILQAVKMENVVSWTGLLSMMETVVASLPQPGPSIG